MTPEENINPQQAALDKQALKEQKKKAFLNAYEELGYKNKACDKVKITIDKPLSWARQDVKFALEIDLITNYWKDRRKEVLDEVMFERGQAPGGYMDRITWLRSRGYEEYNPKSTVKKEDAKTEGALRKLIDRLDKYGENKDGKDAGKGKS